MLSKGVWLGMRVGSKTGFLLSLLYSLPWILLFIFGGPVAMLYALSLAAIVGIIPATTIGLTTGAIVGGILHNSIEKMVLNRAMFVGVLVSSGIVTIMNLLILAPSDEFFSHPFEVTYWFFIGIPSAIYILVSGYMANELAKRLKQTWLAETFALLEQLDSSLNTTMLIAGLVFVFGGVGFGFGTLHWDWDFATFYSIFIVVLGVFLLWLFKLKNGIIRMVQKLYQIIQTKNT